MTTETILPSIIDAPTLTDFTASEVLSLAADLIEQSGWCQAAPYNWTENSYCAVGAVGQLSQADPDAGMFSPGRSMLTEEAIEKAATFINPDWLDKMQEPGDSGFYEAGQRHDLASETIFEWNDIPERTQAEVVAMLRLAAAS
jgi:hypothetical protein